MRASCSCPRTNSSAGGLACDEPAGAATLQRVPGNPVPHTHVVPPGMYLLTLSRRTRSEGGPCPMRVVRCLP